MVRCLVGAARLRLSSRFAFLGANSRPGHRDQSGNRRDNLKDNAVRSQAATMTQLIGYLMTADLDEIRPQ